MASKEDIERFLHYISQIESSGNKNLEHPVISTGLHKGDQAEGQYGMMPKTMDELENRYPSSFDENSTPDDYAKKLAEKVLTRANGDETLAAGLWNQGHNTRLTHQVPLKDPADVRNSEYADKYDAMRNEIPYALDANPYQQKYADDQEEQNKFPQLGQIFKKP